MRTLHLHVGTHKTGTSSIQAFLKDSRAALASGGLQVHCDPGDQANAFGLAHAVLRPGLQTPMRIRGDAGVADGGAACRDAFRATVAAAGTADVLVSAEAFCFLRTEDEAQALRRELGTGFDRIRPILVLREDAAWRRSWAGQIDKMGCRAAVDALPPEARIDGPWYYDRAALLAFWQGIGPVEVVDYDAVTAAEGSVLPAFCRSIGRPDLAAEKDYGLNRSPAARWPAPLRRMLRQLRG